LSTWITLAAIAIALSLPAGLYILLGNLKTLTDDKREVPTISVYINQNITAQQAQDRAELLSELNDIENVKLISVDLDALAQRLKNYPEVDSVQMDIEWVQRLRAIMQIAERVVLVVAVLLGLTVLLVVGNTIRLNIENRKEEIEVTQLVGATTSYIRRPFLYSGFWYGFFGGILSLVIVHVSLLFLIPPVDKLANLYGSQYNITGLGVWVTMIILVSSSFLGLSGAWLAVSQHLRNLQLRSS